MEISQEIKDQVKEFTRSSDYQRLEALLYFKQEHVPFSERCLELFTKMLHNVARRMREILNSIPSDRERLDFICEFNRQSPVYRQIFFGKKTKKDID